MSIQKCNLVEVITDALKVRSHPNPEKWQKGFDAFAINKLPYPLQCSVVTDHIYSIVGPVLPDVCSLLKKNKAYEEWMLDFETNIACVMAEHNL